MEASDPFGALHIFSKWVSSEKMDHKSAKKLLRHGKSRIVAQVAASQQLKVKKLKTLKRDIDALKIHKKQLVKDINKTSRMMRGLPRYDSVASNSDALHQRINIDPHSESEDDEICEDPDECGGCHICGGDDDY